MDVNSLYNNAATSASNNDSGQIARECILVVLGPSGDERDLIQAAKRLAESLHAEWTVVDVQTAAFRFMSDGERARRLGLVRIAESLGGETVTLHGISIARVTAGYARLRKATKILLRSPTKFGWLALTQYSRLAALKSLVPDADVITFASQSSRNHGRSMALVTRWWQLRSTPLPALCRSYLGGVGVTALCTLIAYPLSGRVDLINIAMIFLLGAAVSGLWLGRGPSALTAVVNILAFDYFFVPPVYSLEVLDTSYLVTFAVMLMVGLIVANLMIAVRRQTESAGAREQHTAALYAITRDLAVSRDVAAMITTMTRHIGEVFQGRSAILLCDECGRLAAAGSASSQRDSSPAVNNNAAQWVADKGERAGVGTREFSAERARYLPLRTSRATIGVLVVEREDLTDAMFSEQQRLLEAFAEQLALALERARLAELAHVAHLAAERAAIRNTLLASISHDLRTPLSAIAGAGSIVAQNDFALDMFRRTTLGRLIEEKARDMSDLLTNVLELVRLESGADVLNRDWNSLSDLVGSAIARNESRLTGWDVITNVPGDLPLLSVDSSLILQLLSNLLENAVKYTPPGTRIYVSAELVDGAVHLVIEDSGPGFGTDAPDRLFEKFTRGRTEDSSGGVGLGLAICRTIVRLHGGDIRALASAMGGARFEITLPHAEELSGAEKPVSLV